MVARISLPKGVLAALNYNENKCKKGLAECIAAVNYLREANEMNFDQKLSLLLLRNELNDRATTKTIHVSLNFDPSEKLSNEALKEIGETYMQRLGFGEHPFLIYRHKDAGHPHIHIVSTTIKEDGKRINTHNIGRTLSEKARKEIEIKFGLVKAEKQRQISRPTKPIKPGKIVYGKSELRRSISNVVNEVFVNYKFSSLPEFNAALKQFNVMADRGKEGGRIYKNNGLVYHVLDEKGNKIGVPVKASSISTKPTLKNLEMKFEMNGDWKQAFREPLKEVIDSVQKSSKQLEDLHEDLKKKNISTVIRHNDEGRIYGITFVDHSNKVVFNGSDLGREYSAASLMKKLEERNHAEYAKDAQSEVSATKHHSSSLVQMELEFNEQSKNENVMEELMSGQMNKENVPYQLRKRKKKKRKIKSNNIL